MKENKIALKFKRVDEDTGNLIYKGSDGNIYVSVDGVIHDVTGEGEPLSPVHNVYIQAGEPIYNPADRFGRDPGSKVQEETFAAGGKIKDGQTVTLSAEKLQKHYKANDTKAGKLLLAQLLEQVNNTGVVLSQTASTADINFGKKILKKVPKSILQVLSFAKGGQVKAVKITKEDLVKDKTKELALNFIKELKKDLTAEQFKEINKINKQPGNENTCATHDYVDANEYMSDAFVITFGRLPVFYNDEEPETKEQNEIDFDYINQAWDLAIKAEFDEKKLEGIKVESFVSFESGGSVSGGSKNTGFFTKKGNLPPEYYKTFTLPGNGRRQYNIFQSHTLGQSKLAARKLFPNLSYREHEQNAAYYLKKYKEQKAKYAETVDRLFMKEFGRKLEFTDYKVSGIYTDEFSREAKDEIRGILDKMGDFRAAYELHNAVLVKADKKFEAGGQVELPEDVFMEGSHDPRLLNDLTFENGGEVNLKEIDVRSSNGTISADPVTGKVLSVSSAFPDNYITQIERFDLDEYKKYHNTDVLPQSIDILDLGTFMKDGSYEGPEAEWREEMKQPRFEKGGSLSPKKRAFIAFVNEFPTNAKSWYMATNELPDIHYDLATRYNETATHKYKFNFKRRSETPAICNTRHGEGLKKLLDMMSEDQMNEAYERWGDMIENFQRHVRANKKYEAGGLVELPDDVVMEGSHDPRLPIDLTFEAGGSVEPGITHNGAFENEEGWEKRQHRSTRPGNQKLNYESGGSVAANMDVFGYQTENFDMCHSASEQFKKAIAEIENDKDEESVLYRNQVEALKDAAKQVDTILGIEKILKVSGARASDEQNSEIIDQIQKLGISNARSGEYLSLDFLTPHIANINASGNKKFEAGGQVNNDAKTYDLQVYDYFYNRGLQKIARLAKRESFTGTLDQAKDKAQQILNTLPKAAYANVRDAERQSVVAVVKVPGINIFEKGGSIEYARGGRVENMVNWLESNAQSIIDHYLPGTEGWLQFDTLRKKGDYSIDNDQKGDRSKRVSLIVKFGEDYSAANEKLDANYSEFAQFIENLGKEKGYNAEILSSDEDQELIFAFSNPRTSKYEAGGTLDQGKPGIIEYKGYEIHSNHRSHTSLIYKDGNYVKGIAGDLTLTGKNRITKAKEKIDQLFEAENGNKKYYIISNFKKDKFINLNYNSKTLLPMWVGSKTMARLFDNIIDAYDAEEKLEDFIGDEKTLIVDYVTLEQVYEMGGKINFQQKVKAIANNLKGKEVPKKYKKTYGKKYSLRDATQAAKNIAGSMLKKGKK